MRNREEGNSAEARECYDAAIAEQKACVFDYEREDVVDPWELYNMRADLKVLQCRRKELIGRNTKEDE